MHSPNILPIKFFLCNCYSHEARKSAVMSIQEKKFKSHSLLWEYFISEFFHRIQKIHVFYIFQKSFCLFKIFLLLFRFSSNISLALISSPYLRCGVFSRGKHLKLVEVVFSNLRKKGFSNINHSVKEHLPIFQSS